MLQKVINLKEGLKLTYGAGCPVGRGVGRELSYAARVLSRNEARSNDVEVGERRVTKMPRTIGATR